MKILARLLAASQARHIRAALLVPVAFLPMYAHAQASSDETDVRKLEDLKVEGVRPTDAGPLPGLLIRREQVPGNIQSVGKEAIQESHSTSLGEFMTSQMQSVTVTDYSGNPFQMDVNYRGFTASPQLGTPQGLSVFFDGVRVNEPFGDVVNWDLIPMNAIERFDIFPGSNPLFGLNTLGGALSLRTKSGFSSPGVEVELLGGSWGRRQLQLSAGKNNGTVAGFAALTAFEEDGWRDDSPSDVKQFFGRIDWQGEKGSLTASALIAKNDLIGNGLIPYELWKQRPETVFTSPDQTKNELQQFTLGGALDVSSTFNITGQIYRRKSDRNALNGDIYEGFDDFDSNDDVARRGARITPTLPVCQYVDADQNGVADDLNNPLNGPQDVNCEHVQYETIDPPYPKRNGNRRVSSLAPGSIGGIQPGYVQGTPIGLLTKTDLGQISDGGALQLNWNLEKHKFMIGASIDQAQADYEMKQRLGLIDAAHRVFEDPLNIDPDYGAAYSDVLGNKFDGKETTKSVYFSETWSPKPNLHLTLASRYNHTRAKSNLDARANTDLHEAGRVADPSYITCPSSDPASCPDTPQASFAANAVSTSKTSEDFTFESINPALGLSWLPRDDLNVFANLSRGARVPSVVELGCAFDGTPVPVFTTGDGEVFTNARSLVGPTCSLPTTLSGDPFLPQIRSTSAELGARGVFRKHWEWNASLFRTDLKDDIYFVGVGDGRSYFDTIGETRRQGLELGLKGKLGAFDLSTSYSFVDATFQSKFYIISPHNSSADFDQNSQNTRSALDETFGRRTLPSPTANENRGFGTFRMIRVDPGARLPGIPAHSLNASVTWRPNRAWKLGLTMLARSKSYVRGNENNLHQPGGTDQETGQYICLTADLFQCANGQGFVQRVPPPGRPFSTSGSVSGYVIFNLDAEYRFKNGLRLFGKVSNLFDKQYFTAGRLGVNPFAPSTVGAIGPSGWNYNSSEWQNTTFVGPGSPRAFWVGLQYRWGAGPEGTQED